MGERKVLNKYYPPDFDPSKIPRLKMAKNRQIVVRMMLPMSIRCDTCGTYLYKGTKFNSRKEDSEGEMYLGIQIFRFYFKCTNCSSELTMKTDPEHGDYTAEKGCSRNFEPWKAKDEAVDEKKRKRDEEEDGDEMKGLERRTRESKREMDIVDALEDIIGVKDRNSKLSEAEMLDGVRKHHDAREAAGAGAAGGSAEPIGGAGNAEDDDMTAEERDLMQQAYQSSSDLRVKRLNEDDDAVNSNSLFRASSAQMKKSADKPAALPAQARGLTAGMFGAMKSKPKVPKPASAPVQSQPASGKAAMPSLVAYGASDSDDSSD